jgi:hypothetical protein
MATSALAIMGMVYRGVFRVVKAIRTLLEELKSNTEAVKDIGSTLDGTIHEVHTTLQNHETRITVLERR